MPFVEIWDVFGIMSGWTIICAWRRDRGGYLQDTLMFKPVFVLTDYSKEQCVFGGVCTFSYAQMWVGVIARSM